MTQSTAVPTTFGQLRGRLVTRHGTSSDNNNELIINQSVRMNFTKDRFYFKFLYFFGDVEIFFYHLNIFIGFFYCLREGRLSCDYHPLEPRDHR